MLKFIKPLIIISILLFTSISFYCTSIKVIPDANETRLKVIMDVLKDFYETYLIGNETYYTGESIWTGYWPAWTSYIVNELISIKILIDNGYSEIMNDINVTKLIDLLVKRQSRYGDFAPVTYYGNETVEGFDLYGTYLALEALKIWNALDIINITAVKNFAMERYDNITGGFKEPVIVINGKEYADSAFPDVPITSMNMYKVPNLLTTAMAIAILNITNSLDLIDKERVLNFILACKNIYGLFMPTPNTSALPAPWPYQRGNFVIDGAGSGLAYTYAGVLALYYLGRLDALSLEDRLNTIEYLKALYYKGEGFHKFLSALSYDIDTYDWVFFIFKVLGFLNDYRDWLYWGIVNGTVNFMHLEFDDSFPIPRKISTPEIIYGTYGFGFGAESMLLYCYSVIDSISFLESLTPRALKIRENFAILSIALGVVTSTLIAIAFIILSSKHGKPIA